MTKGISSKLDNLIVFEFSVSQTRIENKFSLYKRIQVINVAEEFISRIIFITEEKKINTK